MNLKHACQGNYCNGQGRRGWNLTSVRYICHGYSLSPSLAIEGARLPSIMHSCHHHYAHLLHSSSKSAIHWTHLDSVICVIPSSISVCSPALFPASALMFVCLCIPGSDAVPVMFHVCAKLNVQLSLPASPHQLRFLHNQVRAASLSNYLSWHACW